MYPPEAPKPVETNEELPPPPAWVVAPVLAIDIPPSPFAAGASAVAGPAVNGAAAPSAAREAATPEPPLTALPMVEPTEEIAVEPAGNQETIAPPEIIEPMPAPAVGDARSPIDAVIEARALEQQLPEVIGEAAEAVLAPDSEIELRFPEAILPVVVDLSHLMEDQGAAAGLTTHTPPKEPLASVDSEIDAAAVASTASPNASGANEAATSSSSPAIAAVPPRPSSSTMVVHSLAERLRGLSKMAPQPQPPQPQPPLPEPASPSGIVSAMAARTAVQTGHPASPEPRRRVEPMLAGTPRSAALAPQAAATGAPAPPELAPAPTARRTAAATFPQNRRLHRRVSLAAEIEIDGTPSQLLDLSMGGFAATDTPPLASDTVLPITLRMTIDGIDISTKLSARIAYAQLSRVGGRFIDLTASQTAFLRYIVTWRGQSVGAIGTTTLLDAIARPGRNFGEDEQPERRGWWSRLLGRLRLPFGSRS